jgi:hypothetical protein
MRGNEYLVEDKLSAALHRAPSFNSAHLVEKYRTSVVTQNVAINQGGQPGADGCKLLECIRTCLHCEARAAAMCPY